MKTKNKSWICSLIMTGLLATLLGGCSKKDNTDSSGVLVPVVATTSVTNVSATSASSGGTVTSDGGSTVIARGVCWSTAVNPTIANSKTIDGTGAGSFTSDLIGLAGDTGYYVRAYATNSAGTGYGSAFAFKTLSQVPVLNTIPVTNITSSSATSGGIITYDGGLAITARGVCWSNGPTPTIADNKTSDGTGAGSFTSTITGLNVDTLYHVRSYATNSAGTRYGTILSFKPVPSIGESYQGGIVAYILQPGDPGYVTGQTHGLIAAPYDQSTGIPWIPDGSSGINIPMGMGLGTGNANTNALVAALGSGVYAAKLCYDLVIDEYSDWYLPSYDELYKLYLHQDLIGGFNNGHADCYWSSYMYNWDPFSLDFYDGDWVRPFQSGYQYLRAIRSF